MGAQTEPLTVWYYVVFLLLRERFWVLFVFLFFADPIFSLFACAFEIEVHQFNLLHIMLCYP